MSSELGIDVDLFWSRANKNGPIMAHMDTPCWVWTGERTHNYGRFRGKRANRVAVMITQGPIPDGLVVRHMCDNPPCVNPSHLLLGTPADNSRDARERGFTPVEGLHYRVKLPCPGPVAQALATIAKARGCSLSEQLLTYIEHGLRCDEDDDMTTGTPTEWRWTSAVWPSGSTNAHPRHIVHAGSPVAVCGYRAQRIDGERWYTRDYTDRVKCSKCAAWESKQPTESKEPA